MVIWLSPAVSTRDSIIKPESISSRVDNGRGLILSPCHTRRRSRGVCVAFLNFLNFSRTPRELQEKMILFVKKASHGVLTASSWRPRRIQGVPTEFSLRSAEFYVAFHGACTTFSLRLRGALGVRTALPRRSHRASTAF